jgi:uncharacterized Tic20 family protein
MTTKQKLKAIYLMYIFSVFFIPLMPFILFFANKERKVQPKKWVKTHGNTLIRYTLLNFAWIFVTVLVVYLAGLVGGKTYGFFLFVGWISMLWLWIFTLDQYFSLVINFLVERELGEPKYFGEMKALANMIYRNILLKIQRRKVKKI